MRSPSLEHHLTEIGIPWEYHDSVAFSKFNLEKSQFNQARVNDAAVDPELVRQYKAAVCSGAKFPAVVVYEDGGEYVAIDGNHRLAAFEGANIKSIDTYEVLAEPEDRLLLTFALNRGNGRPQSEDDTDLHVVTLLNRGVTKEAITAEFFIPKRRIEDAVRLANAQARANRIGRKSAWAKIPTKSAKLELTTLKDDSVFSEFILLTAKFGLGRDAVRSIRQEVEAASSEAERLALIDTHAKRIEKERKREAGRRVRDDKNPRSMMNAHLEYIIQHFVDNANEVAQSLTTSERMDIATRKDKAISALVEAGQILGS